jgi:hypothetical protein
MLIGRYQFSLVESGNVALLVSLISLFTPCSAAWTRAGPAPPLAEQFALLMAALFLLMALAPRRRQCGAAAADGAGVGLQHPAVRRCALFLPSGADGSRTVALHHGHVSGRGADAVAHRHGRGLGRGRGIEPYQAVMFSIAAMLATASTAFRFLPSSPLLQTSKA